MTQRLLGEEDDKDRTVMRYAVGKSNGKNGLNAKITVVACLYVIALVVNLFVSPKNKEASVFCYFIILFCYQQGMPTLRSHLLSVDRWG